MATGTELKSQLISGNPDLQGVNDSLDELVKVLGGDDANAFDPTTVWPDSEINDLPAHTAKVLSDLKAAPVDGDLNGAIKRLLDGVPTGDTIKVAVDAVVGALGSIVENAGKLRDKLGATDRIKAFNELNEAHAGGTYGTANFGLFPAIGEVVNAAGGEVNAKAALAPLAEVAGAIASADGYLIFANYALGTLDLLKRAFVVD